SDFVAHAVGTASAPDLSGSSHDFVSNNPASDGLLSAAVVNSSSVTDPQLDPNGLQSNGGPTQTIALVSTSTSPVIRQGVAADYPGTTTPITTDQRGPGFSRPIGSQVDIGAFQFEVQNTPSFSHLSAPTITYGEATTTISGDLGAGAPFPTGDVAITLDG